MLFYKEKSGFINNLKRRKCMKVLFASSEAYPFAMSGGLADVAGALPKALQKTNRLPYSNAALRLYTR